VGAARQAVGCQMPISGVINVRGVVRRAVGCRMPIFGHNRCERRANRDVEAARRAVGCRMPIFGRNRRERGQREMRELRDRLWGVECPFSGVINVRGGGERCGSCETGCGMSNAHFGRN